MLNYLLIPLFIYEINKARKTKRFIWVKLITIRNYLVFSCAEIENLLWEFGIPTHPLSLIEEEENNAKVFNFEFLVPSSQLFFADIILRQHQDEMFFVVTSDIIEVNGIKSTRYKNKKYQPLGIGLKEKSLVNKIGKFLFGHMIRTKSNKKKTPASKSRSSQKKKK